MEFTKKDTNIVKGAAIILMIFHHCFMTKARYKGQEVVCWFLSESILNKIAYSFNICVPIFVFLTGYGMTMSYKRSSPDYSFSSDDVTKITVKRYIKLLAGFMVIFFLMHLYSLIVVRDHMYTNIYGGGVLGILYFFIDMFGLTELFSTPTIKATFWYISLATILIILMPVMLKIYKRYGAVILLSLCVLFPCFCYMIPKFNFCKLQITILAFALGIVSADKNILGSLKSRLTSGNIPKRLLSAVLSLALIIVLTYLRSKTSSTSLFPVWNGIVTFLIIVFLHSFIAPIPGISHALEFIGIHSMNIFLIHNFIRVTWYYDFTYSFKAPVLIVLFLLVTSLLISILIEYIKKAVRFDRHVASFSDLVIRKLT